MEILQIFVKKIVHIFNWNGIGMNLKYFTLK